MTDVIGYCVRCANDLTRAEYDACSCPKDGLVLREPEGDGMTTELEHGSAATGTINDGPTARRRRIPSGKPPRAYNAASCACGATWTGTSKCHCSAAGCHRLFSSVAMFDRHRVNGKCVAPETIMVKPKDGSPEYPALTFRSGIWCSSDVFTGAGELFSGEDA